MKSLLVTLADENYIDQAKQLFSSVYFNAGWNGDYMLLAHQIPEEKLEWFHDKGILVKECTPLYKSKLPSDHPATVLDKFYLFTPEFKKWGDIIFLDADMIVRYSLQELRKLKGFNAVSDFGNPLLKDQFNINSEKFLFDTTNQKIEINTPAFNTGLMAFSTDIINLDSFDTLCLLFSSYNDICKYGEQPIINLYFYKKWKPLSLLYNFSIQYAGQHYHLKPNTIKGAILHFMASDKPWNQKNPFYDEYNINLERADQICLENRQVKSIRSLNKIKLIYLYTYINIIKIFFDFYYFIIKLIGLIGIFLNKRYPIFYAKILKVKRKLIFTD